MTTGEAIEREEKEGFIDKIEIHRKFDQISNLCRNLRHSAICSCRRIFVLGIAQLRNEMLMNNFHCVSDYIFIRATPVVKPQLSNLMDATTLAINYSRCIGIALKTSCQRILRSYLSCMFLSALRSRCRNLYNSSDDRKGFSYIYRVD